MVPPLIKTRLFQGIAVSLTLLGLSSLVNLPAKIRAFSLARTHLLKPALQSSIATLSRQLYPSRWGNVVAVPSGDTIVVVSGQKQMQLRLCGIDAPDVSQPWGNMARTKLQNLVDRQSELRFVPVRSASSPLSNLSQRSPDSPDLPDSPDSPDSPAPLVAEVLIPATSNQTSEKLLSRSLVESGLAYVYQPYVTECPYQRSIDAAEEVAKQRRQGVWAENNLVYPWEARRQQILTRLAKTSNPLQVFEQIQPTYFSDGMQPTMLGLASWYGPKLHGRLTANGEIYDQNALTAAHHALPFNTELKVTNLENSKSVIVRINDYHPAVTEASIDLSQAAAQRIDAIETGVVPVAMEVLSPP